MKKHFSGGKKRPNGKNRGTEMKDGKNIRIYGTYMRI